MASGLLALLDDVAALAKVASTSLDDVKDRVSHHTEVETGTILGTFQCLSRSSYILDAVKPTIIDSIDDVLKAALVSQANI